MSAGALCEIVISGTKQCGVLARGRCQECGRAFCSSHQVRTTFSGPVGGFVRDEACCTSCLASRQAEVNAGLRRVEDEGNEVYQRAVEDWMLAGESHVATLDQVARYVTLVHAAAPSLVHPQPTSGVHHEKVTVKAGVIDHWFPKGYGVPSDGQIVEWVCNAAVVSPRTMWSGSRIEKARFGRTVKRPMDLKGWRLHAGSSTFDDSLAGPKFCGQEKYFHADAAITVDGVVVHSKTRTIMRPRLPESVGWQWPEDVVELYRSLEPAPTLTLVGIAQLLDVAGLAALAVYPTR